MECGVVIVRLCWAMQTHGCWQWVTAPPGKQVALMLPTRPYVSNVGQEGVWEWMFCTELGAQAVGHLCLLSSFLYFLQQFLCCRIHV